MPDVTIWDFRLKQDSVLFSSLGFSALSRLAERPHNTGKKVTETGYELSAHVTGTALPMGQTKDEDELGKL